MYINRNTLRPEFLTIGKLKQPLQMIELTSSQECSNKNQSTSGMKSTEECKKVREKGT